MSHSQLFDIDRYLTRIGIERGNNALQPNLESLQTIQLSHMRSISFENLDVVNKKLISMDSYDTEKKLVFNNRGGYCFEQNTVIMNALLSLGFQVTPVLARARWNRPNDVDTPYTHLVLLVTIDDIEYLVDVGFGGISSVVPVPVTGDIVKAFDGNFRILKNDLDTDNFMLQWFLKDNWVDLYKFNNKRALMCDQMVGNWYSCTWPQARWTTCLFVSRIIGNERHHVLNSEYCIRFKDGTANRKQLESLDELFDVLSSVFGLSLPIEDDTFRHHVSVFFNNEPPSTFFSPSYLSS